MKKPFGVVSVVLLLLCVAANVQAGEPDSKTARGWVAAGPFYVSVKAGGSFPDDRVGSVTPGTGAIARESLDRAEVESVAVGFWIHKDLRLELEGSYRKFGVNNLTLGTTSFSSNGDSKVMSLMGNAYYDFPVDWTLRPYLMGGIGMARSDINASFGTVQTSGHENNFAYQYGGGFSHDFTKTVSGDVGYRYVGIHSSDENGIRLEKDDNAHEIMAGLRFGFGY